LFFGFVRCDVCFVLSISGNVFFFLCRYFGWLVVFFKEVYDSLSCRQQQCIFGNNYKLSKTDSFSAIFHIFFLFNFV